MGASIGSAWATDRCDGGTVLVLHDGDAGVVDTPGQPHQAADGGEVPGRPGDRVPGGPDCLQARAEGRP
jgi:hypothetical protein